MSDVFLVESSTNPTDVSAGEEIAAEEEVVVAPPRVFIPVPPALTSNIEVLHAEVVFVWQVVDPLLVSKVVGWDVYVPVSAMFRAGWNTMVSGTVRVDVWWDTGHDVIVAKTVVWDTGHVVSVSRTVWCGTLAEQVALLIALELIS
jgi:hypothetical protein